MNVSAGDRIGPYEIKSLLGEGGMGVVFHARDTVLQRDVALKILPEKFANDAERFARFQREAQVLASLNHPNVAQIYGVEASGTFRCLVMEFVGGETLQERIKRGPIPLDDALRIGKQIAEALKAAHEKGITHRDLKPPNIRCTPDERVKVLDFGLAKVGEASAPPTSVASYPTLLSGSMPGSLLGTPAYMSPEQVKGKEADQRSDVWAYGCVLYEMLTGSAAFAGETVGEVLAAVLRGEPDWDRLPPDTPETIRRLIRHCLNKDPKDRLQDIGDARIEIDEAQTGNRAEHAQQSDALPWPRQSRSWVLFVVLTALVGMLTVLRTFRPPVEALSELRVDISTPPATDAGSLAISPDGRKVVFEADVDGSRLFLRSLASTTARPLPGTEGATDPFWSPDNRSVGFFADGKLKRTDIDAGYVQTLATATTGRGGTWNRDGVILFAPSNNNRPIYRIPATGGEPVAVTKLDPPRQTGHNSPQFLPDGNHFLFYASGELPGIYVGQLDGADTRRLLDVDNNVGAVYVGSGQLLFVRQGTLFAQDFDPLRLTLSGDAFSVTEQAGGSQNVKPVAGLSASASGPIIYRTSPGGDRQSAWFDRSGKLIESLSNIDSTSDLDPALSSDGHRLAITKTVNGNKDIWLLELGRGILSRFTFEPGINGRPVWSPDANQIVFYSNRKGAFDLYRKSAAGTGDEEPVLESSMTKVPLDWSTDGRFMLYRNDDPQTGADLWALPLMGDRQPFPVVQTPFQERDGQFSPDVKWIAYQSNESGHFEIYVQPFPGGGPKTQISSNGGIQVRWRQDGKELFYVSLDDRLMALPLKSGTDGNTFEAGVPVPLFATHISGAGQQNRQQYIVSADGQRFLMNTVTNEAPSPITLILNWKPR
jgi:eukaryotic-like serine/threonine-protein kinase